MICIFVMTGKGMVWGDAASCVPGVKCCFIHYSPPMENRKISKTPPSFEAPQKKNPLSGRKTATNTENVLHRVDTL